MYRTFISVLPRVKGVVWTDYILQSKSDRGLIFRVLNSRRLAELYKTKFEKKIDSPKILERFLRSSVLTEYILTIVCHKLSRKTILRICEVLFKT